MADLPDGMLGPAVSDGAGDSPVRGTLVPAGDGGPRRLVGDGEPLQESGWLKGEDAGGTLMPPGDAGLAASPSRVPSKLTTEGRKRVAKADSRVRRRVEHIVATHLQGYRYDISKDKPEGVSDADWRIIRASYSNMKASPAWLTNAVKMWDTLKKADADKPSAPTLNVVVISPDVNLNFGPPLKVER